MNRLQVLIAGLFALSLGTGVVVGLGLGRTPRSEAAPWLASELQLTTEQQDAMRKIWMDTLRRVEPQNLEDRRLFTKERDDQIRALIPEDKQHSYELIVQHFSRQLADLNRERDAAFEQAVSSSMKILDAAQQARYKALLDQGFRGVPWARPLTRPGSSPATKANEPVHP